ncbi:hypothetical protein HU200_014937 [Digitaria exilis]|uniref:Leucine-rich repeat-containing N-terminal plant-type domain-containing protein n=1 Tax=Digitaria exilis TaxID=1010633 RepID=A0A835FBI5_9POAL|nr:hypothetical protein HU200_014937 [Digitaria exilis]
MLRVLCILQLMFYMACGCVVEERIALMSIRSLLLEVNSTVPASWGQSDDCCSWERVTCYNSSRVSDLNLDSLYAPKDIFEPQASDCWNLSLTIFSSFHELQLLDLENNGACLQNFYGLQGLSKLRYLNLSENHLIGNHIFESLSKLTSLEAIHIEGSTMSGTTLRNTAFRTLKNLRELRLGYNQLNGSIPASIFELPRLEYLDLSGNLLQGHIPMTSSSNLPSLQTLDLSSNKLNGTFDFFWLRNCTMLKNVDLSGNPGLAVDVKFDGRVPPFQLKSLMLSGCILDKSIITGPNFLGTQRHLEILDLSNNNLTGSFPNWILANEVTLVSLNLANNSLVGQLDSMWQCPSNLQMINISKNHFAGQLPTNISSVFPSLTVLDASDNSISGDLPPSLCNISILMYMDLSQNKFTGEVPTCLFTDCSNLMILKLSNNNLGGPILGALPNNLSGNVEIIDLHDNKLTGKLDTSFWNLPLLQVLSVATNSLTGQIYPTICKSTYLTFLDLSDNYFSGSLPNCTMKFSSYFVASLDLRYNQFKGSLDWIQNLSEIKMLLLGGNRFEGQISQNLCHLQYFNIIDLSHNRLSGSLPPCIGSISFGKEEYDSTYDLQGFSFPTKGSLYTYNHNFFDMMFGIDLSTNMLSGEIPWEIGNLSRVESLNLSHNSFTGQIPTALANMSAIQSLGLSHNELRCIPNSGQFSSFGAECYIGNTKLHNLSKDNQCSTAPGPIEIEDVREASADDPILYIISAATFVLAFWATVAFVFYHPFGQRVVLQL